MPQGGGQQPPRGSPAVKRPQQDPSAPTSTPVSPHREALLLSCPPWRRSSRDALLRDGLFQPARICSLTKLQQPICCLLPVLLCCGPGASEVQQRGGRSPPKRRPPRFPRGEFPFKKSQLSSLHQPRMVTAAPARSHRPTLVPSFPSPER